MADRAALEKLSHERIDQLIRYVGETGLCAVCHTAPAKRMTCGSAECVTAFLFPGRRGRGKKQRPPRRSPAHDREEES